MNSDDLFANAKLAFLSEDLTSTIKSFEDIVASDPDDALALAYLATATDKAGLGIQADTLYRKLAASDPSFVSLALTNLGYLALTQGKIAEALDFMQGALSAPPNSAPSVLLLPTFSSESLPQGLSKSKDVQLSSIYLSLGVKLQESGRLDDSKESFRCAIEWSSSNGPAWYAWMQAGKVRPQDANLLEQILITLEQSDLRDSDRAHMHFALGKAFDDLGEYGRAMRHFDEGNGCALRMQGSAFDRKSLEADVTSVIKTYTKSRIRELSKARSQSRLPLPIIGMIRSGTTLVEQILSSHSAVEAGGELPFWRDNGYRFLRNGAAIPAFAESKKISSSYVRSLRKIGPYAGRVTDKMPQNFIAVGLIHGLFPQAPIIHCDRNALDTCLSIYMTLFRNNLAFSHSREDIIFFYRQYERLINHWKEVIPAASFITAKYEVLISDRETETRRLLNACGLDWQESCLHPENNPRSVTTASVWQVRQSVYTSSRERWRNYEPWLGSFAQLIST